VAVTRHPTREQVDEILRDFRPDILQTDIEDLDSLELPPTLSVLPVMRPRSVRPAHCRVACCSKAHERQRPDHRLGSRGATSRVAASSSWPAGSTR
jgi:hypothetical protein